MIDFRNPMLYPPELRARKAGRVGLYHAGAGRGSLSQSETQATLAVNPGRSRARRGCRSDLKRDQDATGRNREAGDGMGVSPHSAGRQSDAPPFRRCTAATVVRIVAAVKATATAATTRNNNHADQAGVAVAAILCKPST